MTGRTMLMSLGAAGLIAMSTLPASAQLDDFLCSTFSYKCDPPPPPPAPALAPEAAPAPEATKHARKVHKKKTKATKAKAAADDAGAAAAPDAAAPK